MPTPPPPSPPKKKTALDDPYMYGDQIPTPEAQERNTDTAWALFNELSEKQEHKFSPTVPGSVPAELPSDMAPAVAGEGYEPTAPDPLTAALAALSTQAGGGLDALMEEARRNNRVCPSMEAWKQLYDLLPNKQQVNGQWQPPLPIPPQAWRVTSAMVKRLCLRDHLEWADRHGAAAQVLAFLQSVPEEEWLHME